MYKTFFNKRRTAMRFKHFSNRSYALFSCLGKEVLIGTLSATTLTYAKADGISTNVAKMDSTYYQGGKTLMLDEVNVTGSRAPLTQNQQVRMVTVLSREDIQSAPVQSVNDLLKYAVGVDVRQRGPIGAQTDVSIRGGNYEQIAVLLNGISICDPQTGHNAFDFPVDISEIERIEVLEGPAGRVYGTSSLLGAINIVTRTPDKSSVSAHVEGGSYGYANTGARINIASGKWNNSVSANYTRSDGYSRSKDDHLNMDFNGVKTFYQGNYRDEDITVKWHAGISTKGFGSNSFYSSYSDEQYERTFKTYTAIQAENNKGAFHFHPSIYWNRSMDRFELFRGDADKYPFNYHRTDVYGVNLNGYFDWALGRTAFGAELRDEDIVSTNLGEELKTPRHIHGTDVDYTNGLNRTNVQLVLEHNILLDRFTLSMGLVAVKNSWAEMNMRVYPGFDASYRISNNLKVYASYNSSLRMPSATELYYKAHGLWANKNLKPEELSSVEVGTKYSSSAISASICGYYNHMKNLIDWTAKNLGDTTVWTSVNFGKINALGVECQVDVNFKELMPTQHFFKRFNIAYSYIHQDQKEYEGITSTYVLEYLRHKLVANLQMNLWSKLDLDLKYRYQVRNGNYVDTDGNTTDYKPYGILDGRLQWSENKWNVYVEANNILDKSYRDFGLLKQPGIWVIAGANININL